jgi:hypothetical protein
MDAIGFSPASDCRCPVSLQRTEKIEQYFPPANDLLTYRLTESARQQSASITTK